MQASDKKKEILYWAKLLNQRGFTSAKNGNVSMRIDEDKVLITAHGAYLGHLEEEEILLVDMEGNTLEGDRGITTEKNLHLSVYKKFKDARVVLHAHPVHTTAFFHYFQKLDIFSFEAKIYLGEIKPIAQVTPAVTDVVPVLEALENSNIVVLNNHGVVSVGADFKEAFSLIELLDEQARVNFMVKGAQAQKTTSLSSQEKDEDKESTAKKKYKLMSREHMERLTEVVNSDKEAQDLGKQYNLTCTLAIKNQDTGQVVCFDYQQGKIAKVDNNENAEFVIIGKEPILKKVFNREIEPFVASTQGKVKTRGDFAKMSKWYPVLVRTFKLWEQAPVE